MKKFTYIMKGIRKAITLVLLFFTTGQASHFMGLDVFYEMIGTDTLRIWVQWYKDCDGSAFCLPDDPPGCGSCTCMDINFFYFPASCGPLTPLGPWVEVTSQEDVTPVCGSVQSRCSDPTSSIKGVIKAAYFRDYDISTISCDSIRLELENCCRNGAIDNVLNPGSASLYSNVTVINFTTGKNSSPAFAQDPVPYICLNQPSVFFQGATDPDGDSLSYALGPCWDDTGPMAYAAGYSPTNPLASAPPVFLDPVTGNLFITATQVMDAVICVYVTEWRNGVPIGQVMRDMQVTVIDCGTQQVPVIAGLDSTYAFADTICENVGGSGISYYIPIIDTNSADVLTVSWYNLPPGATMSYNSSNQTLYFNWANPIPKSAPYIFNVFVNDNACPINGRAQTSFALYVRQGNIDIQDTVLINCNTANFNVIATAGTAPYSYLWTGAGLDTTGQNTNPSLSNYYPNSGTYTYYIKVTDAIGCQKEDSATFTISVPTPNLTFNAPADLCFGDSATFSYTGSLPAGSILTWDFGQDAVPGTATGANPPKVTWLSDGWKYITLEANINGCKYSYTDSVFVKPIPVVDAGSDLSICKFAGNSYLNASVTGASGCTYQWTPSVGLSNTGILNPQVLTDTSVTYYLTVTCNGCTATDSVKVTVWERPQVWLDQAQVYYCIGTPGVELPGNVSGGTPPYFYSWTPGYALSNPNVIRPKAFPSKDTTYKFAVTDVNGCVSDSVEVFVRPAQIPVVSAGQDTSICEDGPGIFLNGSVVSQGFGSYTYQWSPATGLSNPNIASPYAKPDSTIIYTLTVTSNQTGCSSNPLDTNSTVVVKVIPKPIANAGPDSLYVCYKDSVQLGDVAQGIIPGYTYQWSPSTGLSDPNSPFPWASPAFQTVYFLTVENSGCFSDVDSIKVLIKPYPQVKIDQPAYSVCKGDTLQITSTTNVYPPSYSGQIFYDWQPSTHVINGNTPNPLVYPKDTTIYYVYAATQNCPLVKMDSVPVIVKPSPQVFADSVQGRPDTLVICKGDTFTLPAKIIAPGPYSFSWTPTTWMLNPNNLNPQVFPQENITYYLSATYGTCTAIDSIMLAVEGGYSVQLSADTHRVCEGDTVLLTAVGGIGNPTFVWMPQPEQIISVNDTTQQAIVIPSDTTTYYITLIEGSPQCAAKDSLTVIFFGRAIADFEINTNEDCDNLKVSFKDLSKNAITWFWDFGDGTISNEQNPIHIYTLPGTYDVVLHVNDKGECPGQKIISKQIIVREPLSFAVNREPQQDTLYLPNSTVRFIYSENSLTNSAVSYYWSFGDGGYSEEVSPVYTYDVPGIYTVKLAVSDSKGCVFEKNVAQIVVIRPEVEVPNVFTPNGDGVNDELRFQYEGSESFEVNVYDRWGRVVFQANTPNAVWRGKMQGKEDAPEGVYFYAVKVGDTLYRGTITLVR